MHVSINVHVLGKHYIWAQRFGKSLEMFQVEHIFMKASIMNSK